MRTLFAIFLCATCANAAERKPALTAEQSAALNDFVSRAVVRLAAARTPPREFYPILDGQILVRRGFYIEAGQTNFITGFVFQNRAGSWRKSVNVGQGTRGKEWE